MKILYYIVSDHIILDRFPLNVKNMTKNSMNKINVIHFLKVMKFSVKSFTVNGK